MQFQNAFVWRITDWKHRGFFEKLQSEDVGTFLKKLQSEDVGAFLKNRPHAPEKLLLTGFYKLYVNFR